MRVVPLLICLHLALSGYAQVGVDTLANRNLEEVVVTATRTERELGALPMPVTLVGRAQIKSIGSVRLQDVLTEQTGLLVVPQVNGQGSGLQLQGFNPDYTLILLDGEPIIGRYTGSLELSRIAVGNIRQIEIVKGPSSSLYGSDALAGVVNIITERPQPGFKMGLSARYGANETSDLNGEVGFSNKKFSAYLFANRFGTAGYDLSPENFGNTVSPFRNNTFHSKFAYRITPRTEFAVSARFFDERQDLNFEVASNGEQIRTSGSGFARDWNLNPTLSHRFSDRLKVTGRFYSTRYATESFLNSERDGSRYYSDSFQQSFVRPEAVGEYFLTPDQAITVGGGYVFETVATTRYGDQGNREQGTTYGFFQHEWTPTPKWSVITGGRYDHNTIYGGQFSPKLSARYDIKPTWSVKLSGGVGFKAPDFRQLYFNFFNTAGGGYSVLGTEVANVRLNELATANLIQSWAFDPSLLGKLKAEQSWSVNLGSSFRLNDKLQGDANLFYNSIDNLIESQLVATTTANQNIYSYRNINRAFTTGLELNGSYNLTSRWQVSAGYQLLYAMDKDVLGSIRRGEVFWRDPETLASQRLSTSEYFGLYNRSRHMGNVKVFFRLPERGWEANVRVIYRGKFGVGDVIGNVQGEVIPPSNRPGNNVLDVHDDFVAGYALVNVAVAKTIMNCFRIQGGVDNVFDYTEPVFIPNVPGRLWYASLSYTFSKSEKSN
ncbi:MAG: TonB-dependent receptor plug domain-containing protein [Cyclobacteriaceae bacterium]|jgi:outer membrane receptor for ferrienterochelin and colicins